MINIELSPRQQNIVAAGITTVAAAIVITASVFFVIYVALFFKAFNSVFLPLAVAAVFAMVLDPWYGWLKSRTPAPIALVLVFLSILIPLTLIVMFFGALIFTQFSELTDQLPVIWSKVVTWFQANRPKLDQFFSNSLQSSIISLTAWHLQVLVSYPQ